METSEKEHKYFMARQKTAEIKNFYSILMFSIVFVVGMAGLNYYFNQWRDPWFLWSVCGVGIGVFLQGRKVYGGPALLGKDWERHKIKNYMEEEKNRNENEI